MLVDVLPVSPPPLTHFRIRFVYKTWADYFFPEGVGPLVKRLAIYRLQRRRELVFYFIFKLFNFFFFKRRRTRVRLDGPVKIPQINFPRLNLRVFVCMYLDDLV